MIDMSKIPTPETSVKKQFDLTDKNIVLTGGAGFLGVHFAAAVAEMGGLPIILDLNQQDIDQAIAYLRKSNFRAEGLILDITNPAQIIQTIDLIVERHQTIDVLINAAAFAMKSLLSGGEDFFASFEDYRLDLWEVSLHVNLTGTFLVTQAIGRVMKRNKKGVVINIASDAGVISPDHRIYEADNRFDYPGVPFNTPLAYSVSKAGIIAMTRYLATYWAKDGIRVNSLTPAGTYKNHDAKFVEQLSYRIPLGRMAFPEEYKGPIVFLASDASSFMTGGNLIVDGGRTAW